MSKHIWTEDDDSALNDAIEACEPLVARLAETKEPRAAWWSAVAGRMLHEVVVSGTACRSRYSSLREWQKLVDETGIRPGEMSDGWTHAAELADRVDRDLRDQVYDSTGEIAHRVRRIEALVEALATEWGIEPGVPQQQEGVGDNQNAVH